MLNRRALALCALAALLYGGQAQAKPHPGPKQGNIEGSITSITAATLTAPLRVTISGKTTVTLNVTASTRIQIGDVLGTAADLHVGTQVHAQYDLSTFNAIRIIEQKEDEEVHAAGVVLSASTNAVTGQTTITLDLNGDGVPDLTLIVTDETKIEFGDSHLTRAQLGVLVGLRVKLEYDSTTFVAKEIEADLGGALDVNGNITAVDTHAGTATVQTTAGPMTFQVSAATSIKLGGTVLALADLKVGDTVHVRFIKNASGQNVAVSIEVHVPRVTFDGTLTAVTASSITVNVKHGASVTMTVDASTDLRINGKVSTLAQLNAALTAATSAGQRVKVSGQYVTRGSTNLAVQLRVNTKGQGF